MAPPLKPPPYTAEQVKQIKDPKEQIRAMAELSSYIEWAKRLQAERTADTTSDAPPSPYRNGNGTDSHYTSRPQRGGYGRGRGGYAGYHPYGRPPAPFRNRSAVFNKPESSDDASPSRTPLPDASSEAYASEEGQKHDESTKLCPAFTSTGICARPRCRRIHDPEKQAICKSWLFKGSCPQGDGCALSHDPNPHNVPTCQHFQQGRCNNDDCRFAHVRISSAALNCEQFGTSGYCEKGDDCFELHAHECPYFSNTGSCYFGDRCRHGHVRRASRLRKATRETSEGLSSSSDSAMDDAEETEEAETWVGPTDAAQGPHHFTQQADFVALDRDD